MRNPIAIAIGEPPNNQGNLFSFSSKLDEYFKIDEILSLFLYFFYASFLSPSSESNLPERQFLGISVFNPPASSETNTIPETCHFPLRRFSLRSSI